jgi:hypothetical protein
MSLSVWDRFMRGFRAAHFRRIAKLPGGLPILHDVSEGVTSWEGDCPRCGTQHPDGQGERLHSEWAQNPFEGPGVGSGYRLFLCYGCGRVLEEDIGQ